MAKNMELAFQIKSNMDSSVISSFKSVESTLKSMGTQMKALKEQEKSLKNFQELKKGANEAQKNLILTNKEIVNASKRLQAMKEAYEKSGRSNKELNKAIKEQEKHIAKLNKQAERQKKVFHAARSELEESRKTMEKYGISAEQTRKKIEELERQQARIKKLDKLQTGLNDTGEKMISSGRSQMMRGAAQGAAVIIPVKLFMDVEESQADLKKMIDFASKQEEEAYSKIFRDLSDKSGLAQTQIFEIAGALAQSGIDKVELPDYTDQAMKMKVAFDMSTEASGEFLAKTKSQLSLTKEELFAYTDTINYLADTTAAQADGLVDVSFRIGSVAKTANVSKETNMALAATLLSTGKTSEVASTGLKNMYLALRAGESATKSQESAYKSLGLSAVEVNKGMVKNSDETLVKVLERLKQLPEEARASTINQLFGKEAIDSVSTMVNQLDLVKENMQKSQDKMKQQDSVNKEYANRMNTLSNQLKKAFTRVMNVGSDLGKSLAPSIRDILGQIEPMVKKVAEWVQKNPQLTSTILKIVAAMAVFNLTVGASKLAFGHLFITAGKAVGLFKRFQMFKAAGGLAKIGPAIAKIGMAIKGVFAGLMAANPLTWIIVGIVAVVAGFVLLYKKSEWFRNGVNKAFQMIKPHVMELGRLIKNYLGRAFDKLKDFATKHGPQMRAAFNAMKPVISFIGQLIVTGIIAAIRNMITTFKLAAGIAKGAFQMIWGTVKVTFGIIRGIVQVFIAFFTGKWGEIPGIASKAWETVKSGIKSFTEGGRTLITNFIQYVKDKWKDITSLKMPSLPNFLGGGKPAEKYTGDTNFQGGATWLAERGRELVKYPSGQISLVNNKSMGYLPKGTKIFNNSATEKMLTPRKSLGERVDDLKERFKKITTNNNTTVVSHGGDTITIHVHAAPEQDENVIANIVMRKIEEAKRKKERKDF